MRTYRVTPELAGLNPKRKLIVFLIAAGGFLAFWLIPEVLWPSSTTSGHLLRHSIEGIVLGTVVGLSFSLRISKQFATYTVVVSDACITCLWDSWLVPRRSIQNNEAKIVVETNGSILAVPGLRISKYGRVGTWFWGCVWIPKALPEYEYVKDLAFSWKARP